MIQTPSHLLMATLLVPVSLPGSTLASPPFREAPPPIAMPVQQSMGLREFVVGNWTGEMRDSNGGSSSVAVAMNSDGSYTQSLIMQGVKVFTWGRWSVSPTGQRSGTLSSIPLGWEPKCLYSPVTQTCTPFIMPPQDIPFQVVNSTTIQTREGVMHRSR